MLGEDVRQVLSVLTAATFQGRKLGMGAAANHNVRVSPLLRRSQIVALDPSQCCAVCRSRVLRDRGRDSEPRSPTTRSVPPEYLRNARKLEIAQQMTNHKSARDQGTMIDGMIR